MPKPFPNNLLIATDNRGKRREFTALLADLPAALLSPSDLGLAAGMPETGSTYAENARLKAVALAQASGLPTLGDDSGLEVAALEGAPGLYSARYAGRDADDAGRRRKLLQELSQIPQPWPARFMCVVAVAAPSGAGGVTVQEFEGECRGEITPEERGANGFGYDPVFWLPEYGRTLAELPEGVKNTLSHRGRAVQAARSFLEALFARVG
ncbi:MAG: RdgB/HAM1 family non-canonical purine NTP pyrophosphatase [Anaerolineales bacterium]|nr:RdgB/HAM1 family non-canonical purine NTP pyrophosphatase [Anaerolineales bacterium]